MNVVVGLYISVSLIHMKPTADTLRNEVCYFRNECYLGYHRTVMSSTIERNSPIVLCIEHGMSFVHSFR